MSRAVQRFLAAALVFGSVQRAAAQSPRPSAASTSPTAPAPLSDSLLGQAKLDYDLARLLYEDGDIAGAQVKFERAYDSSRDPRLLWNMATCAKDQRHYAQALRLLQRYQREGDGHLSATQQGVGGHRDPRLDGEERQAGLSAVHRSPVKSWARSAVSG